MSGSDAFTGAVVRVMPTAPALDHIQDLHVGALGVSTGNRRSAHDAYADLSDAICAALGQLAATSPESGRIILRYAVAAANRRGVDGIESILLSAFLSAMRGGISEEVADAAAFWLDPRFPDRLAGGARQVPLLDTAGLAIGSVRAPELAFAVQDSAGSAVALAERLHHLVGPIGHEEEAADTDDPTLESVARACADAFAATTTAGRLLDAAVLESALESALEDELKRVLDTSLNAWRGPSLQLRSGKSLALAIGVPKNAAAADLGDHGPIPAGLMPRGRRDPAALTSVDPAGPRGRLIPARVTEEPPTWLSVAGRTAEFHPPGTLRPSPGVPSWGGETLSGGRAATRAGRLHVPGPNRGVIPGVPVVATDPLTGARVHPVTGQPIGPSPGELGGGELAEAALTAAQELDIDVRTATVAEVAELFLAGES